MKFLIVYLLTISLYSILL